MTESRDKVLSAISSVYEDGEVVYDNFYKKWTHPTSNKPVTTTNQPNFVKFGDNEQAYIFLLGGEAYAFEDWQRRTLISDEQLITLKLSLTGNVIDNVSEHALSRLISAHNNFQLNRLLKLLTKEQITSTETK